MQTIHCVEILRCPFCRLPLQQDMSVLRCDNHHSFDLAREGYCNLLRKPQPGDSKEMLQARRAFFAGDFYRPLSDLLNERISMYLPHREKLHVLDAGCGEGYYLGRLQQHLAAQRPGEQHCFLGIDISRDAVRMAAKRYQDAFFLVTNIKESLPIADQSIDGMLNIFAPRNTAEFSRITVQNGLALVVIPGPQHLAQLRSTFQLLAIEEQKQQHVIEQFSAHWRLLDIAPLHYMLRLNREKVQQLVMMTPNYWHRTEEMQHLLARVEEVETEVEFVCLLFQKLVGGQ